MIDMKQVCILTTFYEVDSGFSLVSVVETQLKMLLANGFNPIVLVDERWQNPKNEFWQSYNLDIRPVLPAVNSENVIKRTIEVLEENLDNIDVVLTHDIILHTLYKPYYNAIKEWDIGKILWLHWIHSRPTSKRDTLPGYIIYPNASEKGLVCSSFSLQGQEYRVKVNRASHSIDPLELFSYSSLTKDLIKASDFLGGDFSLIYPRGGDPGKQTEKILYLLAGIKKAGYSFRLLVVDWQSQGREFQKYIDKMELLAEELDLLDYVYFTSRLDDRCSQGIPRRSVTELLDLSNIYIHPSNGETYGLVIHEAILRGNLVILNYDVNPMRELFEEAGIYMDFGSSTATREYKPDEETFWEDEAKRLITEYRQNRSLVAQSKALREWTPKALWKEFESLLYL